jgi:hypothetical protein
MSFFICDSFKQESRLPAAILLEYITRARVPQLDGTFERKIQKQFPIMGSPAY